MGRLDWKPFEHFGVTAGYNFLRLKLTDTVLDREFKVRQSVHGSSGSGSTSEVAVEARATGSSHPGDVGPSQYLCSNSRRTEQAPAAGRDANAHGECHVKDTAEIRQEASVI